MHNPLSRFLLGGTLLLLTASPLYADLTGQTIKICEDGAEWPPYHYFERADGKATKKVVGYGIEVLNEIFGNQGIKYSIEFIPWKRCLSEVEKGKEYQMALSGSYSEERDNTYHLVTWYKTSVYYFYSKKQHPQGLNIKSVADFKSYKGCGLLGYAYSYLGDYEKSLDTGAKTYDALLPKLFTGGRCDVFFEQYEILAGFAATGKNYLAEKDLGYAKIPGVRPTWFNMMISKKYENALELKRILSEGTAELLWSGDFQPMLKKHGLSQ